ncbi:MAG: hypothetical protein K2K48_02055 [Anaeroplasmataceae bacterium]|nr:hypothetical protein [Anaeroplasmataceae bacterium]
MKERVVRNFNILISSPSDMMEYSKVVREAILEYNNEIGYDKNIMFKPLDWKHNSIPAYGKPAQDIINEQLVDFADAVIALFGTKFGSPTENFESGTLEEIERSYNQGHEVMTYFYTGKGFSITAIDPEQLSKVKKFKSEFAGLYSEFKNKRDLKEKLKEHLNGLAFKLKHKTEKDLSVYCYKSGELFPYLKCSRYDFFELKNVNGLKKEIINDINAINEIELPRKSRNDYLFLEFSKFSIKLPSGSKPLNEILQTILTIATEFSISNGISIDEDFINIGDFEYNKNSFFGEEYKLNSQEAEEKANKLIKLKNKIYKYNASVSFFNQFDNLYFASFVIKNESNIYAEDITIKLIFDKKHYFDIGKLEISNQIIADDVKDFLSFFEKKDDVDVENMEKNKSITSKTFSKLNSLIEKEPYLENYQEWFDIKRKELYSFIVNIKGDNVIIKFDITTGLKQFTSRFLCAQLMFKNIPDKIEYVITSKSFGHEIKGKIERK